MGTRAWVAGEAASRAGFATTCNARRAAERAASRSARITAKAASRSGSWLRNSAEALRIPPADLEAAPAVPERKRGRPFDEEWRYSAPTLNRIMGSEELASAEWGEDAMRAAQGSTEAENEDDMPFYRRVVVNGSVVVSDPPGSQDDGLALELHVAGDEGAAEDLSAIDAMDEVRETSPGAPQKDFFRSVGDQVASRSGAHLVVRATGPSSAGLEGARLLHVVHVPPSKRPGCLPVSSPRVDVRVAEGASVVVVEEVAEGEQVGTSSSSSPTIALPRTRFLLEKGAAARHVVFHPGAVPRDLLLRSTHVVQEEASSFEQIEIRVGAVPRASELLSQDSANGCLSRSEVDVWQTGKGTETKFKSLALLVSETEGGRGALTANAVTHELRTKVRLNHPGGTIDQLAKFVTSGAASHSIFDGRVDINKPAQGTDAAQLARGLLLTRGATINARPNLRIDADDVAAAHGCTVADLDEEQLFYLASRGISPRSARATLIGSFVKEVAQATEGMGALGKRVGAAIADALEMCDY